MMDRALIKVVGKTANNQVVRNKDARSHPATDTITRWKRRRERSEKDTHRIIVFARAQNETSRGRGLGKRDARERHCAKTPGSVMTKLDTIYRVRVGLLTHRCRKTNQ
jgi:hypothetical protein